MENKEQFKCISPNTGEAFDTWTQTSVSEFSSALERLNDKSFIELSKASNRASALILLSNAFIDQKYFKRQNLEHNDSENEV